MNGALCGNATCRNEDVLDEGVVVCCDKTRTWQREGENDHLHCLVWNHYLRPDLQ